MRLPIEDELSKRTDTAPIDNKCHGAALTNYVRLVAVTRSIPRSQRVRNQDIFSTNNRRS
jgi:hypothetical protein